MAKIIITRINLFFVHVSRLLLHTDLFCRSTNQIMQLVDLLYFAKHFLVTTACFIALQNGSF